MGKIIEVKIGEYRQVILADLKDIECQRDDHVVLEVDRGMEYGRVISDMQAGCKTKTETAPAKVIRKATEGDRNQIANNRAKAEDAINTCARKVNERKLEMQIVKAEYTFDCSKIIFFFLAEGRVDFRNLVKDLAKIFRVRIELKQIGVRDKAQIIGGLGVCGRELCCSSFMKDIPSIPMKMVKTQDFPPNPSRMNGVCGRVKCCMAYEFAAYKDLAKDMPRTGDKITTAEGKGVVREMNILKQYVIVDLGEGKTTKLVFAKDHAQ